MDYIGPLKLYKLGKECLGVPLYAMRLVYYNSQQYQQSTTLFFIRLFRNNLFGLCMQSDKDGNDARRHNFEEFRSLPDLNQHWQSPMHKQSIYLCPHYATKFKLFSNGESRGELRSRLNKISNAPNQIRNQKP